MYSTEKVIKIFEEIGYEYVEGESTNQYSKITIKDKIGYLYYMNVANVVARGGKNFRAFDVHNPYTINNIKRFLELNDSNTELLSTEYVSNETKLKWKCECGSVFERTWGKMQTSKCCCNNCSNKIRANSKKYTHSFFIKTLKKYGYKPLKDDYIYTSSFEYLDMINSEGFKIRANLSQMLQVKGNVDIINKRNPHTIDNMNLILNRDNRINMTILTEYKDYMGTGEILKWKCLDCGKTFDRSWSFYSSGKSTYCPHCSTMTISYISWMVSKWLDENNLNYEKEYRFKDCKN